MSDNDNKPSPLDAANVQRLLSIIRAGVRKILAGGTKVKDREHYKAIIEEYVKSVNREGAPYRVIVDDQHNPPESIARGELNVTIEVPLSMYQITADVVSPPSNDFWDYFDEQEEYPRNILGSEILPINTLWEYVSIDLLNGLVNYADVKRAYLINRYLPRSEEKEKAVARWASEPHGVDLGELTDDVMMLSQTANNIWVFFWFDCDVSDCCIGRFTTEDTEEQVFAKFDALAHEKCKGYETDGSAPYLLGDHTGWIKL